MRGLAIFAAVTLLSATSSWAGEADVVGAQAERVGDGTWRFYVTVRHADEGWNHYSDAWEVLAPDGTVLATRKLLHPHETEQPFTRSLAGVRIPAGVTAVRIRAHDKVHEYGGAEVTVKLPR